MRGVGDDFELISEICEMQNELFVLRSLCRTNFDCVSSRLFKLVLIVPARSLIKFGYDALLNVVLSNVAIEILRE